MAIGAGMTSAIVNPLHPEIMTAIRGADVIMGNDKECANWIRAYRVLPAGAEDRRARRGRRRRQASA